jgi:GT2 family glycosyltransferase
MDTPARKKKIMLAVPCDEVIHQKVVGRLFQIVIRNSDKYDINVWISTMKDIGAHRNVLARDFLKTDCDFLIMVDTDNPPPENMLELVELDKEVIGLPTPICMEWIQGILDFRWNIFAHKEHMPEGLYAVKDKGEGLQEVEAVGSGAMIIRRDVLEKIKHPFTTLRDEEDLRKVGTDIAFCKRCKEAGVKVWTHWDYTCSHFKTIDISKLC